MNTADIIKQARMEAELTKQQLANHYKIPLRTLEDWERGTRTPPEYVLDFLLRCLKEDFAQVEQPAEDLSEADAPKTKIFTDFIGKPLTPDIEAGVRKAFDDGKVQFVGTEDEEGNEIENPRKGKPYIILTPEEYGLDMGLTVFVKEV